MVAPALRPPATRNALIEDHVAFAASLARGMRSRLPSCVDRDELESDAYLGLIRAARTFDPSRGVQFRTFATRHINGAMIDGLRKRNHLRLRLPQRTIWSLDTPVGCLDGHPTMLGDTLPDTRSRPVDHQVEMTDEIESVMVRMDGSSRKLLADTYLRGMQRKQIARRDGVTPSAISSRLKTVHRRLEAMRCQDQAR